MKQKFILFILAFLIVIVGMPKVYARNYSDYLPNPYMYVVDPPTKGETVTLQASYGTCRAQDVGTMFYNFKQLPELDIYGNDAVIHAEMYEEDPAQYKPDEHIKNYRLVYFNRTLNEIYIDKIMETGNIDSTGDAYCELYLQFYISGYYRSEFKYQVFEYRMFVE